MARSFPPLTRRLAAAVVLLLVAAAVATAVLARKADSPPRRTAYRIVYDVEDLTTGAHSREVLEVDRPRVSRRLLEAGGSVTTESGVYDRSPQGTWRQLAVVAPGEPGHDLQLSAPLAWAAAEGLAATDGTDRIAGQICTWWRTRGPLDSEPIAPATTGDAARSCVDGQGRLLADTWRGGGRDLRRRTATAVMSLTTIEPFDAGTPEPIDASLIGRSVERLGTASNDLVRPVPPPGGVLVAAARIAERAPGTTEVLRAAHRAVYAKDGVLVVLDQIRAPAEVEAPRGDRAVALGQLGTGRVAATGAGLVVEVRVGTGLLRVRSGLPLPQLVAWLGTLAIVPTR